LALICLALRRGNTDDIGELVVVVVRLVGVIEHKKLTLFIRFIKHSIHRLKRGFGAATRVGQGSIVSWFRQS
jgi:hypothetical protein